MGISILPTLGAAVLVTGAAAAQQTFRFAHERVLGTSMEMVVDADGEDAARAAEAAALREIAVP